MFGKIVKSVFLNKEARDAMDKRDEVLRRKAEAELPPEPESLADAALNAGREAELDDMLRGNANATDLDRETIREAIESAHRELIESGDLPGKTNDAPQLSAIPQRSAPPAKEHDDLVRSAMLIYRQKQKVLDDLDPASKKKLQMMAKTVFGSQIKK
ncbi:hypothetical protein EOI86_14625 [Hwanghaeella grinnelliae]|uniref:Uncharacterized protein n=1 Tax=Hwanghaeella grinnelliae TaxID=2500179 RepID=A0A3S2VPK8_9PROT|nr:hypothetical protein [Hwanghaeella grinnelliae]RVU36435.1 hypothetical protein EOI86_14625 [Hwanghaeella grinnelliae]